MTNSAVVGPDNAVFGWLNSPKLRELHDVPCQDVVLTDAVFDSENPLGNDPERQKTSPYSAYAQGGENGLNRAASAACLATGYLMKQGMTVVSPIAHSHLVATVAKMDKLDHPFWMKQSRALLNVCGGLLVLGIRGWDTSRGVAEELELARDLGIPIFLAQVKGDEA